MTNSALDQNRLSLLALHFLPGIGDHLIRQLVSYCGSAENVFTTPKGKLQKIPGIGKVSSAAIESRESFRLAEAEITKAEKLDTRLLFFTDKEYPSRLKALQDSPTLLYFKGNADLNAPRIVAIVGSRNATDYGKTCVEEMVRGLIPYHALILSGLAYGIDIAAHRESVKQGLATVGVMGSGIDVMYPAAHRETAKKMMENGGLLTENSFGAKPDAHNFPARNRIIAGLCDALIVVEAALSGGALITAEIANSYNKDVFSFPGKVGEGYSEGCNNLIKTNKANLITGAKDIEYIMNWTPGEIPEQIKGIDPADFTETEFRLLTLLKEKNRHIMLDELSWMAGFSVSQTAASLLTLEFKGVVKSMPGNRFGLK